MKATSRDLSLDLASELETIMKADTSADVLAANTPLLGICADSLGGIGKPAELALNSLLEEGIARIGDIPTRKALSELFLGSRRWRTLSERGEDAGKALQIGYDALRRRNKSGGRRLDELLLALASEIADMSGLEQLLRSEPYPDTPNPGDDAFDRASLFISYSRYDDAHNDGFVSQLRERLISEFRFQTGQELFVFHDKSSIDLGENWRRKLEGSIEATAFLLVLVTPSYIKSEACREELERFLKIERVRARDDLILPIYFATIYPDSDDLLAEALLAHQYIDWRHLRFEPFDSTPVRIAIADLAKSIASAIARTDHPAGRASIDLAAPQSGILERLSEMELAMPRMIRHLVSITAEQEGISSDTKEATEEVETLQRRGRGSAAKLIVARRLSSKLEPSAERMEAAASAMRDEIEIIDDGIHAMAESFPDSKEEGIDDSIGHLIASLREAHSASAQAAVAVASLRSIYADTARIVSTLRPVMLRLSSSVAVVIECPPKFAEWIDLLEKAVEKRSGR